MANRFAIISGSFGSTATWSDTAAGSGGFSVPVSGDNAYANGKTVTIDANATCDKISNQAENGATGGGGFIILAGVTLTANVTAGATVSNSCLSTYFASPGSCTVVGTVTGGTAAAAFAIAQYATGTLNITGNVNGGSNASAYGIYISSTGTVNVTGAVNSTLTGYAAIYVLNSIACNINITGNVTGTSVASTSSILYNASSTATLTITGNVTGGSASSAYGIGIGAYGPTVVVNGNVTGGTASAAYGINTGTYCNLTVNGSATAGTAASAIQNTAAEATVRVTRAIGNGYGVGTSGITSVPSVACNNTNYTYVQELQFGSLGQTPVSGPIILTDNPSNVALMYRPSLAQKTLSDTSSLVPTAANVRYGVVYNGGNSTGSCYVPTANQVLSGVAVDVSSTGTAALTTGSVWDSLTSTMTTAGSIGVVAKNASTMSQADVWNTDISTLTTAGSIGERAKTAVTISTTGQQIANAISS